MCNERNVFETLDHSVTGLDEVGEGKLAQSLGLGTIRGSTVIDRKRVPVIFNNVLFVPALICNLISVCKARRSAFRVTFDEDKTGSGCFEVLHRASGQLYLHGFERDEGLYEAMFQPKIPNTALLSRQHKNLMWHRRLGHVSHGTISKTLPIVKGVKLDGVSEYNLGVCNDCAESKSCRNHSPLATPESRGSTGVLDLVRVDIVGPVNNSSIGNRKYFIPLYDDSRAVSLVLFR